jgi:hypothetical protein
MMKLLNIIKKLKLFFLIMEHKMIKYSLKSNKKKPNFKKKKITTTITEYWIK